MKRRDFVGVGATGLASLISTACTSNSGDANKAAAAPAAAGAAATQADRLCMRFTGLNGFLEGTGKVDVLCLNPKDIKVPGTATEKFHEHVPTLIMPTDSLVDPTLGTAVTAAELKLWNLRTTVTDFRKWVVSSVEVNNLEAEDLEISVYGWVPIGKTIKNRAITDIHKKQVVAATMQIQQGSLTDDRPRKLIVKKSDGTETHVHNLYWWTTTADYGSAEAAFEAPQKLTDVVKWECAAKSPVSLKVTSNGKPITVETKGGLVEPYLVNTPTTTLHAGHEKDNPHMLLHVFAAYDVYDAPPAADLKNRAIPKTDENDFAEVDIVYCPPVGL